jgi:hypothetical protein
MPGVLRLCSSTPVLIRDRASSSSSFPAAAAVIATPPHAEIIKGSLIMREKALLRDKTKVTWAPAPETLPVFTRQEVATQVCAA